MSTVKKKPISWIWIIVGFICFWPVGIVLLFIRLTSDKTATLKNSRTVAIISYVLMGLGAFNLLMAFADPFFFSSVLLFGGGGVAVFFVARNMKRNGEKYKKYIAIVINQGHTAIDNIAAMANVSYHMALEDLQRMINLGYFSNAFINHANRTIVFGQNTTSPVTHPHHGVSAAPPAEHFQRIATPCTACGANNTLAARQMGECEYCGSIIS